MRPPGIREYTLNHIVAAVLLFYALFLSFLLGIFTYYVTHLPEELPEPTRTIKPAVPVDHVAVHWIRKYNPAISEADAADMYRYIERTIERYKADPTYQQGAALKVTPKLFLAVIARESSFDPKTRGSLGEVGLMQIHAKHHVKDLRAAGIIQEKHDLWQVETNIEAGIFILMNYARTAKTVDQSLCFYNAGPARERHGRSYSRAVLRLYQEI